MAHIGQHFSQFDALAADVDEFSAVVDAIAATVDVDIEEVAA